MISTVISFSTLEIRFFDALIKEVEKFCDDIIVVGYDHFFNGTEEDVSVMQELQKKYSNTRWLINKWTPEFDSKFYHNNARWAGAEIAKNTKVLFLDGDEIPDGYLMYRWLNHEDLSQYPLYMFSCYWYFREPIFQAKTTEWCGLLADMAQLRKEMFFTYRERWFYSLFSVPIKMFCTMNNNIIFHHYSWVRTKEEMLTKVKSWGHKNDCNWISKIETEFTRSFNQELIDFVHGYSYNQVLNIFDIKV